jgi:hypothetical protein
MAVMPSARPDYAAHARAVRASIPEVVDSLRSILGPRLCAYIAAVKETRAVHEWAQGVREPGEQTQRRLRLALQIAQAIADTDGPDVARAWFQGLNPQLDDRSPARMLRDGDIDEVGPEIIAAERAFLAEG